MCSIEADVRILTARYEDVCGRSADSGLAIRSSDQGLGDQIVQFGSGLEADVMAVSDVFTLLELPLSVRKIYRLISGERIHR